jgi:hypothetical protein
MCKVISVPRFNVAPRGSLAMEKLALSDSQMYLNIKFITGQNIKSKIYLLVIIVLGRNNNFVGNQES